MEKKSGETTEQALKRAAFKLLLNCKDWSEVTARAITKEAGVNLAMINYCFGSKDALIFEVFQDMREQVVKCKPELLEIINSDMPPKEKLIEGAFEMMKLMLEYYSMSQAVVKFCIFYRKLDIDDGTFSLVKEHYNGAKSDGECMMIAYELSTAHELLVLRHEELKETCGIDIRDDTVLRRIITENINKALVD